MTRAEKGYPGTPGEPYRLHGKKEAARGKGKRLNKIPGVEWADPSGLLGERRNRQNEIEGSCLRT